MDSEEALFPYEEIRGTQKELIRDILKAIKNNQNILVHAPTGIGKTVSALGPALKSAIDKDKVVVFLTSRHTQHQIAMKTSKDIKKKYDLEFASVDIIGKKLMCAVKNISNLYSNEFREYCKAQREEGKCDFYNNTFKGKSLTVKAQKTLKELKFMYSPEVEKLTAICEGEKLCPYEVAMELSKTAKLIVADYFYIFNPSIRETFLNKIGKKLEDIILVIDEGHNLGERIRGLQTIKLSNIVVNRAIKEAKEKGYNAFGKKLQSIHNILEEMTGGLFEGEKLVTKKGFVEKIEKIKDYQELSCELEYIGDDIRKEKKQSSIGSIANFMDRWLECDKGYARILSVKKNHGSKLITLSYRCLDPSINTLEVFKEVNSSVLMSGTLVPIDFYKDILGYNPENKGYVYGNPFPNHHQLNLIIPKTSTKYSKRGEDQYKEIGKIVAETSDSVKGNVLIFFPSYYLRDLIHPYFKWFSEKEILLEKQGLKKDEKFELLKEFKDKKDKGSVLLGVTSGSFGEGVDLPGDLLNGVIIVGIPLQPPDLETKELIKYYDERFGKGWDYGYLLPAITKVLQNAGRCIRSETDKGVVAFIDERYAWNNYMKCFPKDWDMKLSVFPERDIKRFYE